MVVEDLNAHVGTGVTYLVTATNLTYLSVDRTMNQNGNMILSVCKDKNLIVVNNLSTIKNSFQSTLTYCVIVRALIY